MSLHKYEVLRRQAGFLQPSGSIVESDPNPTASSLVQNTAVVGNPSSTPTGIPLLGSSAIGVTSTAAAPSSTSTANSASASSGHQISLATVIGACIAALVLLLLAVLLALYCSKRQRKFAANSESRNAVNNVSRRRSHLEPWKRMEDDGDRREAQAQPMMQRPPSGPLGAMFHRTFSIASGDKSSEGHNRESVGTMQHFAKYHPGLAAEMASQSTGLDGTIAKPPPVLRLVGRGSDTAAPISWDGETVRGDSFFSLRSGLSNSMSPIMMATERATPPATSSPLHHWESAQVLRVSQVGSDSAAERGDLQNPFSDSASSVRSSSKGQNPFFSARDYQPVKRSLLLDPPKNPFADENTPRDSAAALQSLIAALENSNKPISSDRIISLQSSVYSRETGYDGESAISVTAFPYPPTQMNVR